MKEKNAILRSSFDFSVKLMNHRVDIYMQCKHSSKFHRFAISTDESRRDEKVDELSCLSNHDLIALNIKCRTTRPGYFNGNIGVQICQPTNLVCQPTNSQNSDFIVVYMQKSNCC